ncbi:hypothetical protein A6A27_31745 [Micromonospora sp. CB01531]|nr:hypothetical protein A6A27_31745 [Micromonospora sp. CB01531]
MDDLRILIAGAGIAGLAVKHALAERGMDADLVERERAPRTGGTGLFLPANAVRALTELGLGVELAARAEPVRRQEIRDRTGRLLAGFELGAVWGEVGDSVAIRRDDLHDILYRAVGPARVRFGAAVRDAQPTGAVTFEDGSRETYDVVVGADGVNSAVRRRDSPRFLGQICWRFLAPCPAVPAGTWTAMLGDRGRTVLTLPVGGGAVYCFAAIDSAVPRPPAGDWRDLFAGFSAPVPDLLQHGGDALFAPLSEIRGADWVDGRMVLIGDAAHAMSPSMAQGAALALEDALVLAEILAADRRGYAVASMLSRYRKRRAGRVRFVLAQNHRRDRARNLPGPMRNALFRRFGLRLVRANHAGLVTRP